MFVYNLVINKLILQNFYAFWYTCDESRGKMEKNFVNVMEEIVVTLVTILLTGPEYQTFCRCEKCRDEIIVLSLNNLPNHYVSEESTRKHVYDQLNTPENLKWINKRIINAIHTVGKYPNHGN